jgi:hypothetical protein
MGLFVSKMSREEAASTCSLCSEKGCRCRVHPSVAHDPNDYLPIYDMEIQGIDVSRNTNCAIPFKDKYMWDLG